MSDVQNYTVHARVRKMGALSDLTIGKISEGTLHHSVYKCVDQALTVMEESTETTYWTVRWCQSRCGIRAREC